MPFPAGNVTDNFARVVAKGLSAKLGQPVIVDNRPGAAGIIGTQTVAQAKPDGYTMLYASSGPMATFVSLYKHLSYDPLKSFALVNGMATNPLILVVNPSKPYKTLEEFVAYLKVHPGEVNFGSPGIGTGSHLTGELFQAATGTKMRHIPYKDAASLVFRSPVRHYRCRLRLHPGHAAADRGRESDPTGRLTRGARQELSVDPHL